MGQTLGDSAEVLVRRASEAWLRAACNTGPETPLRTSGGREAHELATERRTGRILARCSIDTGSTVVRRPRRVGCTVDRMPIQDAVTPERCSARRPEDQKEVKGAVREDRRRGTETWFTGSKCIRDTRKSREIGIVSGFKIKTMYSYTSN